MEDKTVNTVVPVQPVQPVFKAIAHEESDQIAYINRDHSNQKNYRSSVGVWLTVPAIAKIQAKIGITEKSTNPILMIVEMARLIGVTLTEDDLNRNMSVIEPKIVELVQPVQPVQAVADTTARQPDATDEWIAKQFQSGLSEDQIKQTLINGGWKVEQLNKYFKSEEVAIMPPPPQ